MPTLSANHRRRHTGAESVANVMIARSGVEGRLELAERLVKKLCLGSMFGHSRHGMNHVPQVNDEIRPGISQLLRQRTIAQIGKVVRARKHLLRAS